MPMILSVLLVASIRDASFAASPPPWGQGAGSARAARPDAAPAAVYVPADPLGKGHEYWCGSRLLCAPGAPQTARLPAESLVAVRSRVEGLFDNLARLFECPYQAILPAR